MLKLTDEQKEKVRAFRARWVKKCVVYSAAATSDSAKKMAALRKEFTAKGVAILTDDQKKEWKELTGEPFEFSARRASAARAAG